MNQTKWLAIDELAEYLKMGGATLPRMVQEGDIPAPKISDQWRFDREESTGICKIRGSDK